jgi:hypothetical protein
VEKFIGDAVMAVWGAPVAREDDPERAVRAALELVAAVPALDSALQARAGVLTGEAAVTLGAEGQGMVAGDLVNTASRIQSAAEPGSVLVGETTKRATEASIAYAVAGEHELKGKAEPLSLWRALRVVAARKGEGRSVGLEPPFLGRDRELRLVKELFHGTADEGRAHLLSIVGVPGMGKSRNLRNFTSLTLEPLSDDAIDHLLRGLVPGLPDEAVARIRDRADGIPLYAVETVRMLLDRGLLERGETGYSVTGNLAALDVYLATTLLEYAEWLEGQGRTGELSPVVGEARQIFDQLGARPLLERTERIAGAAPVPA